MNYPIRLSHFPFQEESSQIIGIGIEIQKELGSGFLEIVYKDAFEFELRMGKIQYEREKEYLIHYKNTVLRHHFYADFVVFDKIILELKAKSAIADEDYAQTINYLKCSGCRLGLILNFGKTKMDIKRVIL